MKIGLFSSVNHPLLPHFLAELIKIGLKDLVVLCDEIEFSEKNQRIWHERTGGAFAKGSDDYRSLHTIDGGTIPVFCVGNHNEPKCAETIKHLNIDVLLNAGTPRRLRHETLTAAPLGALNVHPGILPKYRGSSAVEWSILNDDPVGHTAHYMTEAYDQGPIIATHECALPQTANYETVRVSIYKATCRLAAKTLQEIQDGVHTFETAVPQDDALSRVWPPIPDEKLELVKRKLEDGSYSYLGNNRMGHS